jgi:hypothetical protein
VTERQGMINIVAFTVGIGGMLGDTVLVVKGLMRVWAMWDRVVAQALREKGKSKKGRSKKGKKKKGRSKKAESDGWTA